MQSALRWLNHGAEGVAAIMLAALFCTFVLQVFSRYVLLTPFGWTLELCLTLWVWIVFWGNAFIVREKDHVTFDILYLAVRPGLRRILALISALAIVVAMAVSFLPTWDYIDFMKIKKSPLLKLPMRDVFSIYMLFLVAVIVTYGIRIYMIGLRGAPAERHHLEGMDE